MNNRNVVTKDDKVVEFSSALFENEAYVKPELSISKKLHSEVVFTYYTIEKKNPEEWITTTKSHFADSSQWLPRGDSRSYTCRCGEKKVEKATRDGHVCLDVNDANENTLAITCPLPEGAGYTSALSDLNHPRQNNGPGPVLCNTESTVTSQTVGSDDIGDGSVATVAFIGVSSEPQSCAVERNSCPTRYSCQRTRSGSHICCTMSKEFSLDCTEKQVLVGGICLDKIEIGGECIDSLQCLGGSICLDSICTCLPGCPAGQVMVSEICLDKIGPGELCESSLQCQGGSTCEDGICEYAEGQRIINGKRIGAVNRPTTCPIAGQVPYVERATQKVKTCSAKRNTCPKGYSCQFSRTAQQNICCGRTGNANGCSSGTALLFPSTGTSVQCNSKGPSTCPLGYKCVESTKGSGYQCCTTVSLSSHMYNRRDNVKSRQSSTLCPSYQVQVQRIVDGRIVTRCESSCPSHQIVIRSVCKDTNL